MRGKADETDRVRGEALWDLRESLGVSRELLASHLGVSRQQLTKYEKGQNRWPASSIQKAADFLRFHESAATHEGSFAGIVAPAKLHVEMPRKEIVESLLRIRSLTTDILAPAEPDARSPYLSRAGGFADDFVPPMGLDDSQYPLGPRILEIRDEIDALLTKMDESDRG